MTNRQPTVCEFSVRSALHKTEATSLVVLCGCVKPQVLRSQPDLWVNSLILLCESQHRRLDAAGAPFHSFAMNWDTQNSDRQKSTGLNHLFNIWTIGATERTLAQPLLKLNLLHNTVYTVHCQMKYTVKKPFCFSFPPENSIAKDWKSSCWYQEIFLATHRSYLHSPWPKIFLVPGRRPFAFLNARKVFRSLEWDILHSSKP